MYEGEGEWERENRILIIIIMWRCELYAHTIFTLTALFFDTFSFYLIFHSSTIRRFLILPQCYSFNHIHFSSCFSVFLFAFWINLFRSPSSSLPFSLSLSLSTSFSAHYLWPVHTIFHAFFLYCRKKFFIHTPSITRISCLLSSFIRFSHFNSATIISHRII